MHDSVCAKHPDIRARTLTALTSSVPGVGKTWKEYDRTYRALRALSVPTLLRQYAPTWAGVLDAFGLEVPPDARKRRPARTEKQRRMTAQQREQAACDDVAAQRAAARAVLDAERDRQYGIEVCRVVPEPGLRINGNECVRLILR